MTNPEPILEPQTQLQPLTTTERGQIVYVVIVNYHRAELTARAVESVLASQNVVVRAIVVDNEVDEAWSDQLIAHDPGVINIRNKENIGFGGACNQGIERALLEGNCAGVLFLNNDACLEPETLGLLKTAAAEYGLAVPKILLPDGRLWAAGGIVELGRARCRNRGIYEADLKQYDHAKTLRFASACVLYVDQAALRAHIRFYEPYFLYYEDADFCLQLTRNGFEVQYVPYARATHLESASTTGSQREQFLLYYDFRNRVLFSKRNISGPLRWWALGYLHGVGFVKRLIFHFRGQRELAGAIRMGLSDATRGRFGRILS